MQIEYLFPPTLFHTHTHTHTHTVDYQCHPFFQPYELVDDVIKEERRSYALDFLRYMRVTGFELLRTGKIITSLAQVSIYSHTQHVYYCAIHLYIIWIIVFNDR